MIKWIVKKGFWKDKIYNEQSELAAYTKGCFGNNRYSVYSSGKELVYTIRESSGSSCNCCEIVTTDGSIIYAKIKLAEQRSMLKPPRAEMLTMSIESVRYEIRQTENRMFDIYVNGNLAGRISGILNKKTDIVISGEGAEKIIGLLYALSLYMLHEDDVEII
ncbi:MAG: hypothetical protein J6B39_00855 [Lachnospiraceae bacterium]|nr:hypothetical protein [Lachnospiraceae bacterium]